MFFFPLIKISERVKLSLDKEQIKIMVPLYSFKLGFMVQGKILESVNLSSKIDTFKVISIQFLVESGDPWGYQDYFRSFLNSKLCS